MGCCSSCGRSTRSKLVTEDIMKLRKESVLYKASLMTVTQSGNIINAKATRKLMTKKDHLKILSDPNTPQDFKLILSPPFSEVNKLTEFLYLTGIGGLTKENFDKLDINLIINATYEWPNTILDGVLCIRIPVDDGLTDDLSIYFDEVSDKIEEVAQLGGKTLVHCMAGASRSTTLVLAYLIKYERISLKNAFKSVKKRRETARPNIAFFQQLINYEIRVRGQSSVRMIQVVREGVHVVVPDFYEKDYPELFRIEVSKQVQSKKLNQLSTIS